ncbi:hypothetical protein [Roseovarius arcticus]|uniref:hypothetical protein n=1 Tax=Roseovarius arcticus TaxID=2547404 RepID=UPI001110D4A3|nr:hypothetical protein [Roseovarius arcticus]
MRNLLLSAALIAIPVGAFSAVYSMTATPAPQTVATATTPSLGDMAPFQTIVADMQSIVASDDLVAAEKRITDLETAWDEAQKTLRPINTAAWGNVDGAIDAALSALRAKATDPAEASRVLTILQTKLGDPSGGDVALGAIRQIAGADVTDASGRPLPCELMHTTFKAARASANLSGADGATADTFQSKGLERCNADDDARADEFFAQGIALMRK